MQDSLGFRSKFAGDGMRVGVTAEKQDLEKEHTRRPDTGAAAEPGENVFADERLDLEEKESSEENGEGVGGGRSFQYAVFSVQWAEGVKEEVIRELRELREERRHFTGDNRGTERRVGR